MQWLLATAQCFRAGGKGGSWEHGDKGGWEGRMLDTGILLRQSVTVTSCSLSENAASFISDGLFAGEMLQAISLLL